MAVAVACANIALVKYWGKRDAALNLPARGSLSLTLEALRTFTSVELVDAADDSLEIDEVAQSGRALERVARFLDRVRSLAGPSVRARRAHVSSQTTFPIAAGLASSASGFAALAVAASEAYGLDASVSQLSVLARLGSGSAARSIFGGFVRMDAGSLADGSDAVARPFEGSTIELAAAIAVVRADEKEIGSTDGMEATRLTSPYHDAWLAQVDRDLALCERALIAGDFDQLASVVEGSCLAMHADAMAARPGIVYPKPATLWAIDQVRALRRSGVPVMFTIDAGPHLVALTPPASLSAVADRLKDHPEIREVIESKTGHAPQLIKHLPEATR